MSTILHVTLWPILISVVLLAVEGKLIDTWHYEDFVGPWHTLWFLGMWLFRYYTLFGHYCWRIFRQTRNRMGYSFRLIVASSANKQFVHQLRKVPDVLLPCLTRDLRMFAEMGA